MSQILSNAHIECIFNGHRIEGLADEDRPFEFPSPEDMVDIQVGADGGVYGMSVVQFGGPFIVRLAPNSPSAAWAITKREAWKQAQINGEAIETFSGTYADPVQGRQVTFEGGVMLRCPDMVEPGQTFEFAFYFERMIPNTEAGKWLAPLAT